jgi:membrane protein
VSLRILVRKLGHALARDAIDDVGAMIAYYAILAAFPMLLCVVTLAVLVLPANMTDEGVRFALDAVPSSARPLIASQVTGLTEHARAGVAFGTVILAVWGASRGASALMLTLNRVFRQVETRSWLHRQAIAIALTVGLAVLLVMAVALLVAGPMIGRIVAERLGLGEAFDIAWTVGRWVAAGLLVMVVWALAFRFLPDTEAPFRVFTPGAFVSVVLWLVISQLFWTYLAQLASYGAIYGAFGSAVILLTWLWLSGMSLLFAAEINEVLAEIRSDPSAAATTGARPNPQTVRSDPGAPHALRESA